VSVPAVIIDSGGANIASLRAALARLGADSVVTTDHGVIQRAERVLLPGVGSAHSAMNKLRGAGYDPVVQPFDFAFFQENSPPEFARILPTFSSRLAGNVVNVM